jgi:hypothetical protein
LALMLFGLATTVNAFQHAASQRRPFSAFSIQGAFSYFAHTARSDPDVYPAGMATTGEELLFADMDQLTFVFGAHLSSAYAHELHGTIVFQEVFVGDSGW